jgi:hypothetical protein
MNFDLKLKVHNIRSTELIKIGDRVRFQTDHILPEIINCEVLRKSASDRIYVRVDGLFNSQGCPIVCELSRLIGSGDDVNIMYVMPPA